MKLYSIWTKPGLYRSGEAEDAYPPLLGFVRQYKISGILQFLGKLYSGAQKLVFYEGTQVNYGKYRLLQLKLDWATNRFDDFLSEVANTIDRLFSPLNSNTGINSISIDAYAERFRWIDWSKRVADGPPQKFYLEVNTNDSSKKAY
jgi:hypothetical protein